MTAHHATRVRTHTDQAVRYFQEGDYLSALNNVRAANDQLAQITWLIVDEAHGNGVSKAAMCRALDVPRSTLRGL